MPACLRLGRTEGGCWSVRHVELVLGLEDDCDESGVFSVEAQHHTGRPSTMQHYMLQLINMACSIASMWVLRTTKDRRLR
jgi:hypothetical protein